LLHKSGITDKTSIFRLELANHPRIVKCPALKRFLLLMLSWTAITLLATGDLAQAVEIAARAMALSLSREGAAREHALSFRGFWEEQAKSGPAGSAIRQLPDRRVR
jgi:hypothetical protein